MRRLSDTTPVIAVVLLVLAVAAGVALWYADVRQQAQTQDALVQTREAFERFERERRSGSPDVPTTDNKGPATALTPAPAAPVNPTAKEVSPPAPARRTVDAPGASDASRETPVLLIALLLTAVVALILAGSSYRMVRRERRARIENENVVRETRDDRAQVFRSDDVTIIDAEPLDAHTDEPPELRTDPPVTPAEVLSGWLQHAPFPVLVCRPTGEIEMLNPAFTRILGYTTHDVPTLQTWLTRVRRLAPEHIGEAGASLRARFGRDDPAPFEMTAWTRAGEPRHWLVHSTTLQTDDDQQRWLLIGTDITERARAEHAAAERAITAQERAEDIGIAYQASPTGLATFDNQLRFVQVNDTMAAMTGLRAADHAGQALRNLLPQAATALAPVIEKVLQTSKPEHVTVAVRTPASPKADRHWLVSCAPAAGGGTRTTRVTLAAADITERHAEEAQLRESETALRAILTHLPAPVCVKDLQGRYVYANPAYEQFVRTQPGQLNGRMDHEVLMWESADRLRECDDDALASEHPVETQGTARLGDRDVAYTVAKTALRDSAGQPYAVCAVYGDDTSHAEAERGIKAAEARYRAMFETSPQPLLVARDNRLAHVNAACLRLLGADREQAVRDRSILDFIDPSGHEAFQARIQRCLRRKPDTSPLAAKVKRVDGTMIDTEIELALYDTGEERAVQIAVHDMTERRRTEDALRAAEAHMRQVAEATPALVRIADAEGNATYWNNEWSRHTGIDVERALGQGWLQSVHTEDRDALVGALRAVGSHREKMHLEYRLRTAGGAYRWMLDILAPRFDETGVSLGHASCIADIEDRKQIEMQGKSAAAHWRAAAEHSPALLWTESGDALACNAALRDTLGLAQANGDWTARIHDDDKATYARHRARSLEQRLATHASIRVMHATGEYRLMLVSVVPLQPDRGPVALVGSMQDITDLRRAEQAVRQTDQRRHAFVAALGADLRTPLAPLRHAAEVLRLTTRTEPTGREAADMVIRNAQYVARLLEDAADFSHLLARPQTSERAVAEIGELVHEAVSAARPQIEARRQTLNITLPGGLGQVVVERKRVVQALTRLFDYAARQAPESGMLALSLDEHAEGLRIDLTLAGVTLDEPPAALFELFPESGSPSGIALPLVRHLIEAQGAAITAAEGPDGLRFSVSFPPYEPAANGNAGEAHDVNGHRRVLVVDEDSDSATGLRLLLELQGHEVRVATNPAAALPAAREFHPDTVMIDGGVSAPRDLVRALRLLPETAHTAVWCVNAECGPAGAEDDRLFDQYLVKPVEPRALQHLLTATSPTVH